MITRPMLAPNQSCHEFFEKLRFPLLASPKIDGLRCYKANGKALTRSGKPFPNTYVRKLIEENLPDGVDGELTAGDHFRASTSDLRCSWTKPNFIYNIFDCVNGDLSQPFEQRIQNPFMSSETPDWVNILDQYYIYDIRQLLEYEDRCIAEGYEGVMLRSLTSPYKCNRATIKEGYLYKLKRFVEAEATIIGFYEQEENQNELFTNELGTSSRSSHAENKYGKNTLGGIIVQDVSGPFKGSTFKIGTGIGWTSEWRQHVWDNQDNFNGKIITYKHLPHGNYDLPRNASMKGFRETWDMEAT